MYFNISNVSDIEKDTSNVLNISIPSDSKLTPLENQLDLIYRQVTHYRHFFDYLLETKSVNFRPYIYIVLVKFISKAESILDYLKHNEVTSAELQSKTDYLRDESSKIIKLVQDVFYRGCKYHDKKIRVVELENLNVVYKNELDTDTDQTQSSSPQNIQKIEDQLLNLFKNKDYNVVSNKLKNQEMPIRLNSNPLNNIGRSINLNQTMNSLKNNLLEIDVDGNQGNQGVSDAGLPATADNLQNLNPSNNLHNVYNNNNNVNPSLNNTFNLNPINNAKQSYAPNNLNNQNNFNNQNQQDIRFKQKQKQKQTQKTQVPTTTNRNLSMEEDLEICLKFIYNEQYDASYMEFYNKMLNFVTEISSIMDFRYVSVKRNHSNDIHKEFTLISRTVDQMSAIKQLLVDRILKSTLSDYLIPYNTVMVNNNKVFNDLFVYFRSTLDTFYDYDAKDTFEEVLNITNSNYNSDPNFNLNININTKRTNNIELDTNLNYQTVDLKVKITYILEYSLSFFNKTPLKQLSSLDADFTIYKLMYMLNKIINFEEMDRDVHNNIENNENEYSWSKTDIERIKSILNDFNYTNKSDWNPEFKHYLNSIVDLTKMFLYNIENVENVNKTKNKDSFDRKFSHQVNLIFTSDNAMNGKVNALKQEIEMYQQVRFLFNKHFLKSNEYKHITHTQQIYNDEYYKKDNSIQMADSIFRLNSRARQISSLIESKTKITLKKFVGEHNVRLKKWYAATNNFIQNLDLTKVDMHGYYKVLSDMQLKSQHMLNETESLLKWVSQYYHKKELTEFESQLSNFDKNNQYYKHVVKRIQMEIMKYAKDRNSKLKAQQHEMDNETEIALRKILF